MPPRQTVMSHISCDRTPNPFPGVQLSWRKWVPSHLVLLNKKTIKSLRLKFTNSRGPFIPLYDYNKMFGCCHGSCHPPNQSQDLPQGRATLLREELSQHGAYQYFHQRENWFSSKAITEITWFHLQLLHGALGSPPSYRLPLGWPQDLRLMGQVEKPFVSP